MLSDLINWAWVVEAAPWGRDTLMGRLLIGYDLIASWESDDESSGDDAHLFESPFGLILLTGRFDHDREAPDPWDDAYRNTLRAEVNSGRTFQSYENAVEELEEQGSQAGPAAELLPALRGFITQLPPRY